MCWFLQRGTLKQRILNVICVGRVRQVVNTTFGSNLKNKKTDAYFAIRERANKNEYLLLVPYGRYYLCCTVLFVLVLYYLYFV